MVDIQALDATDLHAFPIHALGDGHVDITCIINEKIPAFVTSLCVFCQCSCPLYRRSATVGSPLDIQIRLIHLIPKMLL